MKITLKTLILAAVLCIILTPGCVDENHGREPRPFTVITIDGCEYIQYSWPGYFSMEYSITHKGDCKNPIHNYHRDTLTVGDTTYIRDGEEIIKIIVEGIKYVK